MSHQPTGTPARDTLLGGFWILLADGLFVPTALVVAAYLARRLGPSQYGLFVLAATIAGWLEWLLAACFSRAVVRQIAATDDWRPVGAAVVRAMLVAGLGIGGLLLAFAGPVSTLLGDRSLGPLLRLVALYAPVVGLALAHRFLLTGLGWFRARAVASSVRWLSRLALVVVLVETGLGVRGAIAATIAGAALEFAVARWFVRPPFVGTGPMPWRAFGRLAASLFLAGISTRAFERVDLICIQTLGGRAADTGLYGAAQSLATLPPFIVTAFAPVLLSSLTRLVATGNREAARDLARQALRGLLWLVPLAGAVAGAADEIVLLLFGPEYAGAGPVLAILCVASVPQVVLAVVSTLLVSIDRAWTTAAIVAPLVPLAVAGHLFAIPRFGGVGAAAVTASVSCLTAGVALVALKRMMGVAPPAATALRVGALAVSAYLAAGLLPGTGVMVVPRVAAIIGLVGAGLMASGEIRLADVRALLKGPASPAIPDGSTSDDDDPIP